MFIAHFGNDGVTYQRTISVVCCNFIENQREIQITFVATTIHNTNIHWYNRLLYICVYCKWISFSLSLILSVFVRPDAWDNIDISYLVARYENGCKRGRERALFVKQCHRGCLWCTLNCLYLSVELPTSNLVLLCECDEMRWDGASLFNGSELNANNPLKVIQSDTVFHHNARKQTEC